MTARQQGLFEQRGGGRSLEGAGEVEALSVVAAELAQAFELGRVLEAFGDGGEPACDEQSPVQPTG